MGVLDRFARGAEEESYPYCCVSCGQRLPVQYHACPECDSYDIRAAKWLDS
jgi:predicted RNA-binding Zn-ribbon protein involved in translation (DUF1610 family)